MPVAAKICGLSTPDAVDAAVEGGASDIGFVFYRPSPRNVMFGQAHSLITRVPLHVGRVGVFVDPDDHLLNAAVATGLNAVQLHKVTPARAADIRRRVPVCVAIPVRTQADVAAAAAYRGAADGILYDAKTPDDAALPGGMGLRFDWRLLQGHDHPLPWGLSGGLDAANVKEAVTITGARMVDVSSGVESAPGVKDVDKIAGFLKAVGSL